VSFSQHSDRYLGTINILINIIVYSQVPEIFIETCNKTNCVKIIKKLTLKNFAVPKREYDDL
jgi:hypothetical protein